MTVSLGIIVPRSSMPVMSRFISLLLVPFFLLPLSVAEDFYSFTVKDSEGEDVSLERYRGKVC